MSNIEEILRFFGKPVRDFQKRYFPFLELYQRESKKFAEIFNFTGQDVTRNKELLVTNKGDIDIGKMIWFISDFHNPFYGGIYTILRFAAFFRERKNIQICFVVIENVSSREIKSKIEKAFPILADSEIIVVNGECDLEKISSADISVCTLWSTAYYSLKFNKVKRKFYFIQDYEALFYPAGSISGQVEETYRFGFYGITNTISLKRIYTEYYGGKGEFFTPAVDTRTFYPSRDTLKCDYYTLFFYGRPGHPRNGFELGITALKKMKTRMGEKVRIFTAGADWEPKYYGLTGIVENLGVLSINETAELYRRCDAGVVLMFTRHPSYLPLELMASGCPVVTNFNPSTTWLLHDKENCFLTSASADCLCDTLVEILSDEHERTRVSQNALNTILNLNWDREIEKIYQYMRNPEM